MQPTFSLINMIHDIKQVDNLCQTPHWQSILMVRGGTCYIVIYFGNDIGRSAMHIFPENVFSETTMSPTTFSDLSHVLCHTCVMRVLHQSTDLEMGLPSCYTYQYKAFHSAFHEFTLYQTFQKPWGVSVLPPKLHKTTFIHCPSSIVLHVAHEISEPNLTTNRFELFHLWSINLFKISGILNSTTLQSVDPHCVWNLPDISPKSVRFHIF